MGNDMDEMRRRALLTAAGGGLAGLFGTASAAPALADDAVVRAQQAAAGAGEPDARLPISCKLPPFNCKGDSRYDLETSAFVPGTDDTAGMKAFFDYCIRTGASGYIPAGRYWIDWGALEFDNGHTDASWPEIATAGFNNVFLIGRGNADKPMLSIVNGGTNISDDRVWQGGSIGGFTVVQAQGSGFRNRHALQLAGVQQIEFGYVVGLRNEGHVLHCPRRTVTLRSGGANPDPFHVYACRFQGIFGLFNTGWTIRNENGLGLNQCNLGNVRAAGNGGGFYGWGGDNLIETWSSGSTAGWALHDGSDVETPGSPYGLHILTMMEVDDTRHGFFIGRAKHCRFQARVIHRYNFPERIGARARQEGYWPLALLQFGQGANSDGYDNHITIYQRIDGPDGAAPMAKRMVHPEVRFGGTQQPLRASTIHLFMQDNIGYGFSDADYYAEIHPALPPECRITLGGKTIYDRLSRSHLSVSCARNLAIPSEGYPTAAAILPFDNVRWDRGGDAVLDPGARCHGFRANRDGECRFAIGVRIQLPAGTRIRLGILAREGEAMRFTGAGAEFFQAAGSPQFHLFQVTMRVSRGTVYFPCGDQASGATVEAVGLQLNEVELYWQAEMIEGSP